MDKHEALDWFLRRRSMALDDKCQDAEDIAIECIMRAIDGDWIRVEDRLPEEYGNYLAVVDGEVTECTYSGPFVKGIITGWSTCEANGFKWLRDEHVTHWMPLPEPPKEEEHALD